jgi:hypothetical protein
VPLETYETALKYICTTKTRMGLKVTAALHPKTYQTGEHVTEEERQLLNIRAHRSIPEWNYTISPQTTRHLRTM